MSPTIVNKKVTLRFAHEHEKLHGTLVPRVSSILFMPHLENFVSFNKSKFCSLKMQCYAVNNGNVNNGMSTGNFSFQGGTKQENLLSAYLFTLASETL